jgi:hypothetical protein
MHHNEPEKLRKEWIMDPTPKPSPVGESKPTVEVAQYLWEEYSYRHDLIWRLLFKVTAVATTLSIAPFGIEDLVVRKVGLWIAFLPVLAVVMVVGSWPLFRAELHRFQEVKDVTRTTQNKVVEERVHDERGDVFDWLIPLYLSILFVLSLIVALLVWFKWYPSL